MLFIFAPLKDLIKINEGFEIPIALLADKDQNGDFYYVRVDGVPWLYAYNRVHAVVLFEMMKEHLTEYVHYEQK